MQMYWSMYAYVGNNAKELADLEARRDFRYPKEDNKEGNKGTKGKNGKK